MVASRHRFALFLILSSLLACGSEAPAPSPTFSFDELLDGVTAAACDWQVRCCSPLELAQSTSGRFATQAQCLPYAHLELEKAFGVLRDGLAQGRVTLDATAAMACLEAQRTRVCNGPSANDGAPLSFATWFNGCLSAFTGKIAEGRRCGFDAECAAGERCAGAGSVGATSDGGVGQPSVATGTCLPHQKRGDACQLDGDCATEDFCSPSSLLCTMRATDGQPCDAQTFFGAFTTSAQGNCAAGLNCSSTTHLCGHLPRAGETCQISPACDPDPTLGLSCVGQGFNGLGVCKPAGKAGDACGPDGLPPCAGTLTCGAAVGFLGTCIAPPGVGEPCTGACASPAICDTETAFCMAPGPQVVGDVCATPDDCASRSCQLTDPTFSEPASMIMHCQPPATPAVLCAGATVNRGGSLLPVGIVDGGADGPGFFDGGSFDAASTETSGFTDAGVPLNAAMDP